MSFTQTVNALEEEIRKTPYNKATEHHIGKLRARLARIKEKQLEKENRSVGGGTGFAVKKQGDATVVLIGPPSVGKSTLLNRLTNAKSKVAPYIFSTVSVIPGMLLYRNAHIQILDLPGLIEGARQGKGLGKEVISVARVADLLVIMSEIGKEDSSKTILNELEKAGIRINKERPKIKIQKKISGGIVICSNTKQLLSKETIRDVVSEFGIKNATVTLEENITLDQLLDCLSQSTVYLPAIFVVNKADKIKKRTQLTYDDILYISAKDGSGLEQLKEKIWEKLKLVELYLIKPGEPMGRHTPIIMKKGETLYDITLKIGSEFARSKKLAKIWGGSASFPGQSVPLTRVVEQDLMVMFI